VKSLYPQNTVGPIGPASCELPKKIEKTPWKAGNYEVLSSIETWVTGKTSICLWISKFDCTLVSTSHHHPLIT
jgi:hypothetical protein